MQAGKIRGRGISLLFKYVLIGTLPDEADFFCPFFPDLSLNVFTLSGNHSSELLHLLLLHMLWDAIFQNIPAMHANQSMP